MTSSNPTSKPILKMSVLAPPKLGFGSNLTNNKSTSESNSSQIKTPFPGLKQSKLSGLTAMSTTSSSSSSSFNSASSNPFALAAKDDEGQDKEKPAVGFIPLSSKEGKSSEEAEAAPKQDPKPVESGITSKPTLGDMKPPVSDTDPVSDTTKEKENFVFGQNLTGRAANFQNIDQGDKAQTSTTTSSSGKGSPETSENSPSKTSSTPALSGPPAKTLAESAAEYCESHAHKRKYEEVKPITGEEHEINAVQVNAKLHVFDKKNSSWSERGRGSLRLNDLKDSSEAGDGQQNVFTSRLVMRTAGVLRVILNTPIFTEMSIETPTEKTIRLSGTDEGQLKIFLITAAPKDIQELHKAILKRKEESHSFKEDNQPPQKKSAV